MPSLDLAEMIDFGLFGAAVLLLIVPAVASRIARRRLLRQQQAEFDRGDDVAD
jgi:hypothetical protein